MALPVDDNSARAWQSKDDEANREFKKSKHATNSLPEKDAETLSSRFFDDLMKNKKKMKDSKNAMNSQPDKDVERMEAVSRCVDDLKEMFEHPKKAMKSNPDILKKVAERLEADSRRKNDFSHPNVFKKGATSMDDMKEDFEKMKKNLPKEVVENIEKRFEYNDLLQKLLVKVPCRVSTEIEDSDDENEFYLALLESPRRCEEEYLEHFRSVGKVFGGGFESWDKATETNSVRP